MLTEFGVLTRLDDYPYQSGASRLAFTFEAGWMKNINERDAVGISGRALASDPVQRIGIRGRYRRWLGRNTSVEVMPGVLVSGEDTGIDYDPPGFMLGAAVNAGDLIAVTVETEYSRYKDYGSGTLPLNPQTRTDVSWRAGARLGSGLGLLGAGALFGLILYIGLSGGFD